MNEKKKFIIIFIASHIVASLLGFWAGFEVGKSIGSADLRKTESKLSELQISYTELQTENSKHIETISRLQRLGSESTGHIQLLETGIAELERLGKAKDGRIIQAEDTIRGLSAEVDRLEEQVNRDSERFAEILEEFRNKVKNNNGGINSDSNYSGDHNFKVAEEIKYKREYD